ncbi:hypothetical protein NIASO_08555 [Niabella soli DSM 19437]|uniref:Disease resistance R13L4/SHOC-2-like LRR domain-containing protein n=2 Tax=Niabella TaxID=379899 RepID=W0F6N2_9BACT|nr:hypothetical protein NIASO_08555 [Niabella soli DSM 19437]
MGNNCFMKKDILLLLIICFSINCEAQNLIPAKRNTIVYTSIDSAVKYKDSVLYLELKHDAILKTDLSLIAQLPNLTQLSLYGGGLTQIPESIYKLGNLRQLTISYNKISSIPKSILKLKKLEYLALNNTRVTEIPGWIKNMSSLKSLVLERNNITTLKNSPGLNRTLNYLSISNNQLKELPASFKAFSNLKKISPIISLPIYPAFCYR